MANCCICGKKTGMMSGKPINVIPSKEYYACSDCAKLFKRADSGDLSVFPEIRALGGDMSEDVKKYLKRIEDNAVKADNDAKVEERAQNNYKNVMLTTTPNFDGYRIVEYCGIVTDESIEGLGLIGGLSAAVGTNVASVTGGQISTFVKMIDDAKKRMMDQLKLKAARIGANAIVGVDFENSVAGSVIMVSMNGTAVKIEKE